MITRSFFTPLVLFCFVFSGLAQTQAETITAAEPDPAGLVAHYKFDGNANDSAGSNHGIEFGSPVYEDGKSGQAIKFDGKDDYIVIDDSNGQAPIEFDKGSFSIAFWIKSDFVGIPDSRDKEFIICNGTNGTEFNSGGLGPNGRSSGKRYVVKFEGNNLRFVVDDDTTKTLLECASDDFATGGWVHVVAVRDCDSKKLLLYRNALLEINKIDKTTGSILSPGEPLFIGAKQREDAHADDSNSVPIDYYFKGMLDDIWIYDYALSQDEIAGTIDMSQIQVATPSAETLIEKAGRYDKERRFEEARDFYQQIIEHYPDSPEADKSILDIRKIEILSLFDSKQEQEMQEAVNKLITDFSEHTYLPEALYTIGVRCQNSEEYEKAETVYKTIATNYPDTDYAFNSLKKLTILYVDLGKEAKAKQTFERMNQKFAGQEDLSGALSDIALAYEESDTGYQEAQTIYQQIEQQFPDSQQQDLSLDLLRTDIITLIEQGDFEKAEQDFDKLVSEFSTNPNFPKTLDDIAEKFGQAGLYDEARAIYEKVLTDHPGTDDALTAQKGLVILDIGEGNDVSAQAGIDKLMADFRYHIDMPDSIFTIGEQYCLVAFQDETDEPNEHTKRLFQKPITIWERMIAELPYSDLIPYAYYYSAVCYRKLGEFEKAVEYFQKAESDLPDDDEYAAKAQFRIGNCYEGLRNKGILPESEANSLIEKSYKAVIEKYPDSSFFPDSAMIVGRHNLRMGQWAEAAKYFEMLLEKAPESPLLSDVLYDLGLAYEQINEPDMAMEIYRTFIETAGPDDPRKEKVLAKLESLKGQSK